MKKLMIASLLVGVSLYLMMSAFVQDFEVNKYDTRQTAVEQKAIAGGRVPEIVPESAYDIAETYDKKTNTVYGAFNYKESDEKTLMAKLKDTGDKDHTMEWGNFLFHVDREKNRIEYKTKSFDRPQ